MISAVILTKNEEGNIEKAIKSVEFCDEIIVVDDDSNDTTIDKIKSSKSKVQIKSKIQILNRKLNGDFAGQRNYGMEKAKGEWVFFLDADEVVTEELKKEIIFKFKIQSSTPIKSGSNVKSNSKSKVQNLEHEYTSYYIKRRDFWWGRELKFGETLRARQTGIIRLVKKNSGKWKGTVHEIFQTSESVGQLNNYINHYPHQSIAEFLKAVNYYSTLRANQLSGSGSSSNILQIIFFPFLKFIYTYFVLFGFLDGPAGFIYSFMMSFHSFLVRSKLFVRNKEL